MKKQTINYKDAYFFVKKRRPYINPNKGFVKQLKMWEANINQQTDNQKMTKSTKF